MMKMNESMTRYQYPHHWERHYWHYSSQGLLASASYYLGSSHSKVFLGQFFGRESWFLTNENISFIYLWRSNFWGTSHSHRPLIVRLPFRTLPLHYLQMFMPITNLWGSLFTLLLHIHTLLLRIHTLLLHVHIVGLLS